MLVHRRVTPSIFAGTHLYSWVERGTVRIKCLAQEYNTMSPARTRTRTNGSGVKHTNHEATMPPTSWGVYWVLNHEAKSSGFRPNKTWSVSLLNSFRNIPQKACPSGQSEQKFKLQEESISVQEKQAMLYQYVLCKEFWLTNEECFNSS